MHTEEAKTFLKAFRNRKAREFVRKMKTANYTGSILKHHPRKENLENEQVLKKCRFLIDTIFEQFEAVQESPGELSPLLNRLTRNNPARHEIWFAEFDEAYTNYKHYRKLNNRYRQLKPYLHGKSYCDIGCGGGDLVAFLKQNYQEFETCAGIDVLDWRTDGIKDEINFQMLDFSKPGTNSRYKFDTVTCLAVLHHVGNTDEALSLFLKNAGTAINKNGRMIVEEDVILPAYQTSANPDINKQVERLTQIQPLFAEFVRYSEVDQRDITIIIDVISNALCGGVPQMAFPFGFRSLNQWIEIFSRNNYNISEIEVLGYAEGVFNRSGHVLFVLTPAGQES